MCIQRSCYALRRSKEMACRMLGERGLLVSKTSAREVVEAIMAMKDVLKTKFCITLWSCWAERNRIREREQNRDPVWLVHSIQVTADEWSKQGHQQAHTCLVGFETGRDQRRSCKGEL